MAKKKVTKKSSSPKVTKSVINPSLTALSLMTLFLFAGLLIILNMFYKTPQEVNPTSLPTSASTLNSAKSTTYSGTLPCADCSGIKEDITLSKDGTYLTSDIYIGRNDNKPTLTKGKWEVITNSNAENNSITYKLTADNGQNGPLYYLLTSNGQKLSPLDNSTLQPITSEGLNFTLTKVN